MIEPELATILRLSMRYICGEVFKGPTIVYNYPKTLKAFYMRVNDDDATVQMDILIPKISEVIGGSVREDRFEMLAFKQLDPQIYWWYRELRRYGSVTHADDWT
jgi:asparaginyl-tRNA synthetase